MELLKHGSLFSGIGGFDLAAEWIGWENLFHCEYNPFCQRVLKHYWPQAHSHGDIKKTDFRPYSGAVDILSGGFPCQPFSSQGERLGTEDDRHLWPEMLRAIREIQPRWIVGENVRGLTNWNGGLVFDQVQADLEAEGYEVLPFLLPALAIDAAHQRDRVWFIAYAERFRQSGSGGGKGSSYTTPDKIRQAGHAFHAGGWPAQPMLCRGINGLPGKLDGITFSDWSRESHQGYGNAVVPQLVLEIFKVIQKYENQ